MNPELKKKLATGFNEWMRRYIEDPAKFAREFESVARFRESVKASETPTYGDDCVAYLETLL